MTSTCRSCGALIVWARTEHGKRIPLDAAKVPHGNIRLTDGVAIVLWPPTSRKGAEDRYVSHFATCGLSGHG